MCTSPLDTPMDGQGRKYFLKNTISQDHLGIKDHPRSLRENQHDNLDHNGWKTTLALLRFQFVHSLIPEYDGFLLPPKFVFDVKMFAQMKMRISKSFSEP